MRDVPVCRSRWVWYAVGVGMIAWGARGLVEHTSTRSLLHAGRFFLLGVVGHDGLVAPVAFVLAALTQRLLPPAARTPVRVGLAVAGLLVLLALPALMSDHRLRNPSVLPLDYGRNLGLLLAAVAAGALVGVVVNVARSRRSRS